MTTTDPNPEDPDVPFPIVSTPTEQALSRFAPLYQEEFYGFKADFIQFLMEKGKNTFKEEGYAPDTVQTTHYKIEQVYRWKWQDEGGFTKEITPDDAGRFVNELVKESPLADREVRDFIKAIKRLFKWFNDNHGTDYDWTYDHLNELEQRGASKRRHYFEQYEMTALYNAAVEMGSLRSYHSVSPEQRDRLKIHLAQRLEKPKEAVGPDDFKTANSWKFPSLLAMSIDLGLRPIEVERARTDWLWLGDEKVVIPRDESSKEKDDWECSLTPRSVRALRRWLTERQSYEKYDETNRIWLTKYDNPYGTDALNDFLGRLLPMTDIKPRNRDLTWYSIRRGAATMWANNIGLEHASEQLRHKKLETTKRYTKGETDERKRVAADLW